LLPLLFLVIVVAGGLYVRSMMREQQSPHPEMTDDQIKTGWRKLGFFCELDAEKRVWVLTGSRAGLLYFPDLLLGYVADPKNATNGALEHYGPYGSLEVMNRDWMAMQSVARSLISSVSRVSLKHNLPLPNPGSG
jgi:hypothetical protein